MWQLLIASFPLAKEILLCGMALSVSPKLALCCILWIKRKRAILPTEEILNTFGITHPLCWKLWRNLIVYPSSSIILKEISCHQPAGIITEVFNKQPLGVWFRNETVKKKKKSAPSGWEEKRVIRRENFFLFANPFLKKIYFVFQEGNTASEAVMGELFCQGIFLGPGHVFQICSCFMLMLILRPVKFWWLTLLWTGNLLSPEGFTKSCVIAKIFQWLSREHALHKRLLTWSQGYFVTELNEHFADLLSVIPVVHTSVQSLKTGSLHF